MNVATPVGKPRIALVRMSTPLAGSRVMAAWTVVGSAPKWRRQSRFFSPTVEYVLKKAPSEVLIVAFPQGVLEGDGAAAQS